MAAEHAQAAKEILAAVGGPENVVSAAHCATRLRLVIADDSKVNMDAVEDASLAKGNFQAAGQLQVIYGTGTVNKVFDEFCKQGNISVGSTDDAKAAAAAKGNPIQRATKALGDVFVPIIPAIVASGLMMGLTEGLNNAVGGSLAMNPWWILIHTFSNASFVFLQILIGFSAARVFGGNEFLGGVIGMIMNHTGLMNAWSIPGSLGSLFVGSQTAADTLGLASASEATAGAIMGANYLPQVALIPGVPLLGAVPLQGYQGHVIPVVVAVFIMCKLEKWLHEHVPDMFDLFVTPLVTVLVTGLLTMVVIGPIFSFVEELVMAFFSIYTLHKRNATQRLEAAHTKLQQAYDQLEETTTAKERIESELRIARDIQMSMVPSVFPQREGLDMFATMTPAKEVGGDLYGYLLDGDKLYFALGDVSGKGVPASLFMAQATRLAITLAKQGMMPAEICTRINDALSGEDNESGMFVTFFLGLVDLTTGHLDYCNAGHNPPIIGGNEHHGDFLEVLPNAPIGLWPGLEYEGEQLETIKGRPLFLYSDGLNEAEDREQNQFGDDRLLDILRHTKFDSAQHVIEHLSEAVEAHRNGAEPNDDLTMFCLRIS